MPTHDFHTWSRTDEAIGGRSSALRAHRRPFLGADQAAQSGLDGFLGPVDPLAQTHRGRELAFVDEVLQAALRQAQAGADVGFREETWRDASRESRLPVKRSLLAACWSRFLAAEANDEDRQDQIINITLSGYVYHL